MLQARRRSTQLITPPKEGGEKKTVCVKATNFIERRQNEDHWRNRSTPRPYLILGFDTEYQSLPSIHRSNMAQIKSGGAQNELLSYQFCCSIIYPDKYETVDWTGIIIPKSTARRDRLSLGEFIVFALGSGVDQFPKIEIPTNIYLTAHFTRADMPAFSEFSSDAGRASLNLENIRNTFVSSSRYVQLNVADRPKDNPIELRIQVRDTLHLAPAGKRSVAEIGKMLEFEKIQLADTMAEEKEIKRNMAKLRDDDWPLFRKYAIRDAEVCVKYAKDIVRVFYEQAGFFKLPVTLTSIGISLLEKKWKESGWNTLNLVGREEVKEKKWNSNKQVSHIVKRTPFTPKVHWKLDFVTESYHGGRNEQFWFGPCLESKWNDYDLTSAYPSAMSLIGKPDWDKIKNISNLAELLSYEPTDLAFASVDFEFTDKVLYPVLPVRTQSGIIFPLKGSTVAAIPEILLAHKLGAKLTFIEGVYVPTDKKVRIFEGFIKDCIEKRNNEDKGTVKNLFWKELSNSTYGKTAQGLRQRRIYDLRSEDTKPLEMSKITNPLFASFITSFCRATLGEILNRLPRKVCVFSVTTDGFLTNADDDQIKRATTGPMCRLYKQARQQLTPNNTEIYETKHKIRQPLGWRTRGQATLIPATKKDWGVRSGKEFDEDTNLVLAKGGIKINDVFEKAEQNDDIIRMFLERDPSDEREINIGLGIRNMYVYGNDFVDVTLTRKLSMEFDWKRRPHYVNETSVRYDGTDHRHLFFSTRPWKSLEEFVKIRELWEEYNRDPGHCLKTLTDYTEFARFVENKLSLTDKNAKYLSTRDGDLKRLRMEFCRAWRHGRAGTHRLKPQNRNGDQLFPDRKLSHKLVVEILEEAGVPCKIGDVENSKNKEFEPHRVPTTARTRAALIYLKNKYFPRLQTSEFLTRPSELSLDSVSLNKCHFSKIMINS